MGKTQVYFLVIDRRRATTTTTVQRGRVDRPIYSDLRSSSGDGGGSGSGFKRKSPPSSAPRVKRGSVGSPRASAHQPVNHGPRCITVPVDLYASVEEVSKILQNALQGGKGGSSHRHTPQDGGDGDSGGEESSSISICSIDGGGSKLAFYFQGNCINECSSNTLKAWGVESGAVVTVLITEAPQKGDGWRSNTSRTQTPPRKRNRRQRKEHQKPGQDAAVTIDLSQNDSEDDADTVGVNVGSGIPQEKAANEHVIVVGTTTANVANDAAEDDIVLVDDSGPREHKIPEVPVNSRHGLVGASDKAMPLHNNPLNILQHHVAFQHINFAIHSARHRMLEKMLRESVESCVPETQHLQDDDLRPTIIAQPRNFCAVVEDTPACKPDVDAEAFGRQGDSDVVVDVADDDDEIAQFEITPKAVQQLCALGFSTDAAIQALKEARGNAEVAANHLFDLS